MQQAISDWLQIKGGYLDFSRLTELEKIYITEIDCSNLTKLDNIYITEIYIYTHTHTHKSSIIKNHKIKKKKKMFFFHGFPLKGYIAS